MREGGLWPMTEPTREPTKGSIGQGPAKEEDKSQ